MIASAAAVIVSALWVVVFWLAYKTHMHALRANARERSSWESERQQLLNRIMFMADRPWQMPESEMHSEPQLPQLQIVYPEQMLEDEL